MRKKSDNKVETVVKEEARIEVGFKIKMTNLRKDAYPNPLVESDYFKWKVGDILTKGNTFYVITQLSRMPLTETQMKLFKSANVGGIGPNAYTKDQTLKRLLEEYEKKGNFGHCKIHLNPLIRGGKEVLKPRGTSIMEITNTGAYLNYRSGYSKTDLLSQIKTMEYQASSLDYKIQRMKDKKTSLTKRANVLEVVYNKLQSTKSI